MDKLDLPHYLKTLEIVELDDAVKVLVCYQECINIDYAEDNRWRERQSYRYFKEAITQKIKLGRIIPLCVFEHEFNSWDSYLIDLKEVDINTEISNAKFKAEDIWKLVAEMIPHEDEQPTKPIKETEPEELLNERSKPTYLEIIYALAVKVEDIYVEKHGSKPNLTQYAKLIILRNTQKNPDYKKTERTFTGIIKEALDLYNK